ncbi:hypothetical protein BDV12DRAFT_49423 [Aspergillus spectabilis]
MPPELHQITPFSRDIPHRLRQKPKHKNVQKARLKHNRPSTPAPPPEPQSPFFNRFFALPTEIRLEIYRHLLIRPCKFDLSHLPGCNGYAVVDYWSHVIKGTETYIRCAECSTENWARYDIDLTSDSPIRSQWARPKKNPLLCDVCYADKQIEFGMDKCPDLSRTECLCARHENLGVLLINRRVYEEASPIFWTENTFVFENGRLLFDFLEAIGSEKREMIRSIAFYSPNEDPIDMEEVPQCWPLLRQCSGLRHLELDATFLSDLPSVLELSSVRARRVRFVTNGTYDAYGQALLARSICPWVACRVDEPGHLVKRLTASMEQGVVDEERLRRLFAERVRLKQIAAAQETD